MATSKTIKSTKIVLYMEEQEARYLMNMLQNCPFPGEVMAEKKYRESIFNTLWDSLNTNNNTHVVPSHGEDVPF